MIKFNVNEYVKVKLTPIGLAELKRQHDKLAKDFPKVGIFNPPAIDENGYSRFQLHSLMYKFGHLMHLGGNVPFETTIIIEEINYGNEI